MWLSLFLVLFLFAATYFQAIQGLTSTLIMTVLTAVCAALAFGTYEYVAETALTGLTADFAHAIAFLGMFLIPLFVLRLALDHWISRANLIPHLLDRGAAGVIGFFASFVITGMLAIGLQMVPWQSIIGYQRFVPTNADPRQQNELWLRPDRFAAKFGSAITSGVFGGPESFASAHPDLVTEIGWLQAGLNGVRRSAPPDALTFQGAGEIPNVYDATGSTSQTTGQPTMNYEPVEPAAGRFLKVAVRVDGPANKLGDTDKTLRYVPAAIRLVGETNGRPEIYCGIAVPDDTNPNYFVRSWQAQGEPARRYVAGLTLAVPSAQVIEVVFDTPKAFTPREVRYKFGASAAVTGARLQAEPPPEAPTPAPTPTPTTGGGRVSGVKFKSSHFGDDLPMTMTAYQSYDTESSQDVLAQGHIEGRVEDQGVQQSAQPLSKFKVPAGKALLQLNVENLRAGSLLGKALNQAAQTVENYVLEDNQSHRLLPIGKYAIAKVGNEEMVEIMYFPEYVESGGRIRPFSRIKSNHLVKDYQLVYLYLMESGAKATRFVPGGNLGSEDLSGQNLVAP